MKPYAPLFESVKTFEDLSVEVMEDIAEELKVKYPAFTDTTKFWNDSDITSFIKETDGLPALKIKQVSPKELRKQFKNRTTSKSVVEKYKKMIQGGVDFDPVIVSGNKFMDGGHRVQAYFELNIPTMSAIDIKPILDFDWDKEIQESFS